MGGNSTVGQFSHIGIGASVFHGINVGNNCIIGGGSVVNRHLEPNSVHYGVPARFITSRELGDNYL